MAIDDRYSLFKVTLSGDKPYFVLARNLKLAMVSVEVMYDALNVPGPFIDRTVTVEKLGTIDDRVAVAP